MVKNKCNYVDTCESQTKNCYQEIELRATPVIQNKFWIVESNGKKVGTIEKNDDGVVYAKNQSRTFFKNLSKLTSEINIVFDRVSGYLTKTGNPDLGGYPVEKSAYNILYDVKRKLYVYTKTNKSKSYFCAGHYAIKLNGVWIKSFCPKLITVQRYEFCGPFKSAKEVIW